MTWIAVNALLSVVLVLLCIRAWMAGRSRSRAEARWREAEARVLDLLADAARKNVK